MAFQTSMAHKDKEDMTITITQSNAPRGSVLNIFCMKGRETAPICNIKDIPQAAMSFLLVNNPSLNIDSVLFRQLKEWKSWLQASTINAAVRARPMPSFSKNSTITKASKLQNAIKDPWISIVNTMDFVTTDSSGLRGGRFIILGSTGSIPRASAGNPSVTRFTHNICIGKSGTGKPIREAVNITRISPALQDKR